MVQYQPPRNGSSGSLGSPPDCTVEIAGGCLSSWGSCSASGRRTVTTWLRAVGVTDDFSDYYYFLQPLGRKAKEWPSDCWGCCWFG